MPQDLLAALIAAVGQARDHVHAAAARDLIGATATVDGVVAVTPEQLLVRIAAVAAGDPLVPARVGRLPGPPGPQRAGSRTAQACRSGA